MLKLGKPTFDVNPILCGLYLKLGDIGSGEGL
jgi:hypothetical protein